MLRNAVVHISNEQPFIADLLSEPTPSDSVLICRNIRTMNGKKPIFVDSSDSTFLMPLNQIRFVEIPASAYAAANDERATERTTAERKPDGEGLPDTSPPTEPAPVGPTPAEPAAQDLSASADDTFRAVLVAVGEPALDAGSDDSDGVEDPSEVPPVGLVRIQSLEEGLDGDLLRRIREI